VGRLFTNKDDTVNKTEIVLLITPRVIRNIERPAPRLSEFNSGTEAEVGAAGGAMAPQAPLIPPPAAEKPAARPAPLSPAAPAAPGAPGALPAPAAPEEQKK